MVIGIARHSETGEKMVVYVPMYDGPGVGMAVRPMSMFNELVQVGDEMVPRFTHVENGD